jgi:hypothetical protein
VWWLTLFEWCHRGGALGPELAAWPDAGPALRQPLVLHQAFGILRAEARAALRQAREAAQP